MLTVNNSAYFHRVAVGRRFASRVDAGDAVFLTGAGQITELPCTVSRGERRQFSGANAFILLQVMKDQGWTDSRFFNVDQIKQAGWSIAPGAKQICLQFLVANGDDGLPLEHAQAKLFHVFNASEIAGVSHDETVPRALNHCLALATQQAGFSADSDGVRVATCDWLAALQGNRIATDPVGTLLRVNLAATLLEVQAGLSGGGPVGETVSAECARGIAGDPLSFFEAVNDAQTLAATVMRQVTAVAMELQVSEGLAHARELLTGVAGGSDPVLGGGMKNSVWASARVEAAFAERAALLVVPFEDKDRAKALGAVWYAPAVSWFVPKGVDVSAFKEWFVRPLSLGPVASEQVLMDSFRKAMEKLGLKLKASEDIQPDGKWHNVSVDSYKDGKNKSGSYIFSLDGARDGSAIGTIMNKHTGESYTWKHAGALLTPEQRARMRVERLMRDAAAASEVAKTQDVAALHADEIWSVGLPATDHGYVIKKGIPAQGFRQVNGAVLLQYSEFKGEDGASIIRECDDYLIVPLTNAQGQLRAVQAISPDGSVKTFMRGAQKKGTMLVLGAESFDVLAKQPDLLAVAFVEGVSTGASFRQASDLPVVVCFDAGNLETVVADVSPKLPVDVVRVLAVDDDQFHVERALGFLSEKIGINPHAQGGQSVNVFCGSSGVRSVGLGDAVADGEWHQSVKGTYRVTFQREDDEHAVRSVVVDVVPVDGGRKMSSTFVNRGVEAGRKAMLSIEAVEPGARAAMVIPEFSTLVGRPTDWNDLVNMDGVAAVRAVLRGANGIGVELCDAPMANAMVARERPQASGVSR